ncbi:MAG: leucyl/phenylalanyl-tRNA--protein transferase [Gammaproteobacteria bacterium]|nr:leucyl/phenylalanyl-tRNA--protein transferase [Gammaproteobacteria bacterium]
MGFRLQAIRPEDPVDSFPDPATMGVALGYPDGLLAIGGDLSPERLIAAYTRGIFPWFNAGQPILWWSPDPRAVLEPVQFHKSRSLIRMLRRGGWEYSVNNCFARIVKGCAQNRGDHGTWITAEMLAAYTSLHELGYAHSIECWFKGKLAGGIYGIRLGELFFGESMFSTISNGSKVALTALAELCPQAGVSLIDCQLSSPHLTTLGMVEIPRQAFLKRLADNTQASTQFTFCTPKKSILDGLIRHREA